ncbi:hypothetical protein ACP70R_030553 [Stipagrostis hirtigluma subsp. patula]
MWGLSAAKPSPLMVVLLLVLVLSPNSSQARASYGLAAGTELHGARKLLEITPPPSPIPSPPIVPGANTATAPPPPAV